jgi:hypothetical protein
MDRWKKALQVKIQDEATLDVFGRVEFYRFPFYEAERGCATSIEFFEAAEKRFLQGLDRVAGSRDLPQAAGFLWQMENCVGFSTSHHEL